MESASAIIIAGEPDRGEWDGPFCNPMLIPYEIETLLDNRPVANWVVIALTSVVSLCALAAMHADETGSWVETLILDGWGVGGLAGHVLLHGGLWHLVGNMLYLWVFGNAICSNAGPRFFLLSYLACGLTAAVCHLVLDGSPAIGASGAVNGVVGITLAAFPVNRMSIFWFFLMRWGTFTVRVWLAVVFWLVFDLYGALTGGDGIAYWAHLGGLTAGVGIGLLGLHRGWICLSEWDNRSLLEILRGDSGEQRRDQARFSRIMAEQEEAVTRSSHS
jgi:membrane associated rhomboid family serine protease